MGAGVEKDQSTGGAPPGNVFMKSIDSFSVKNVHW